MVRQLDHRRILERRDPVAVHLAVLGHAQRQRSIWIDAGRAAKKVAQRACDRLLAIERDFHNQTPQCGFDIGGLRAQNNPGDRRRAIERVAQLIARAHNDLERRHLPIRRGDRARLLELGGQPFEARRQSLQIPAIERLDARPLWIGAVVHMIIETALVAGHLAATRVRDRQVEIPPLAVLARNGAWQPGELAAQKIGHRRFNHRLLRAVQVNPHRARRVGRPDSHQGARTRRVDHDELLPSGPLLLPQKMPRVGIRKPILGRRLRFPVIRRELFAGVGRIRELRQTRQVGHVLDQRRRRDPLRTCRKHGRRHQAGRGGQ